MQRITPPLSSPRPPDSLRSQVSWPWPTSSSPPPPATSSFALPIGSRRLQNSPFLLRAGPLHLHPTSILPFSISSYQFQQISPSKFGISRPADPSAPGLSACSVPLLLPFFTFSSNPPPLPPPHPPPSPCLFSDEMSANHLGAVVVDASSPHNNNIMGPPKRERRSRLASLLMSLFSTKMRSFLVFLVACSLVALALAGSAEKHSETSAAASVGFNYFAFRIIPS